VGRHSIPDPEDSPDEGVPEEPPTRRFGRQQPTESDYDESDYDESDNDESDYDEPEADYAQRRPPRAAGAASSRAQHSGEWEGGEWTGSHRAVATGRRGVSVGVIAALVAVVVLAVSVLGSGTSAESFHAALAPTDLAPGATGEATLTKTASGWRIELDATGLPRLDSGRFYEGWLRDAAGVLVPIGTFNEGKRVTLWAGVSPTEFTTLTVTRERADGDQSSSGEKVLDGKVDTGS